MAQRSSPTSRTDYTHRQRKPPPASAPTSKSPPKRNPGTADMMDLYGLGDHGGGPTRNMLDQAEHYIAASTPGNSCRAARHSHHALRHRTALLLGRRNQDRPPTHPSGTTTRSARAGRRHPHHLTGQISIPTWKDELYLEFHRGIFTTQGQPQAQHARQRRWRPSTPKSSPPLPGSTASPTPTTSSPTTGARSPSTTFHDLAAGSGIAVIYRDAQKEYDKVFTTDHIIARRLAQQHRRQNRHPREGQHAHPALQPARLAAL